MLNWWIGDLHNTDFPSMTFMCVYLCTCVSRVTIRPHVDGGKGGGGWVGGVVFVGC